MRILHFLLASGQGTHRPITSPTLVWVIYSVSSRRTRMGKQEASFPACCVKFAMSWSVFKPPSGILPMQELSWTGYSTSPKPHTEYERLFPCLFSWVTCLILSADLSFLELISNKRENSIRTGYQFTLRGCHNSIWLVIFSFFFLILRDMPMWEVSFQLHGFVASEFIDAV